MVGVSKILKMFIEEVSYAHQGCIFFKPILQQFYIITILNNYSIVMYLNLI